MTNTNPNTNPYDRAYFDGDSKQGYYPPGYQNFPSNYTIANKILELKPKSFLELGGCRGYISHILESQGIDSTTVDVAPHCWHTRACKKFILADATNKLPFQNKQFDLLFSKDFLEHIPEDKIDDLIKETIRVSKRGLHLVTFSGHPNAQDDKTHKCLKDRTWWIEKFNQLSSSSSNLIIEWAERGMENAEILIKLHNIEKNIPLPLFGSKHWSRKVEYPWAIQNSDLVSTDRILNAGSGTDVLGFYLSKFGSVINLDNNPEVIEEGTKLIEKGRIENLENKLGDICSIPYEDNYFDKVFCISVIEHMDSDVRNQGLKELLRVLKPGGILILTLDIGETFISEEELPGLLSIFPDSIIPQKSQSPNILTAFFPKNDKTGEMVEISVLCIKYVKPIEQQSSNPSKEPYHYIIEDKEIYEKSPVTIPQAPTGENLVKLNIGPFICMTHYGWINIDKIELSQFANQNGYIFRQHDIANGIPYPNNLVDIIIASHFLEHLDREEGNKFLKDCLRVLKIGGIIRLTVPDTDLIIEKYRTGLISEYKDVNIGVEKAQLQNDDTQSLYELLLAGHKTIYGFDSLSKLLSNVGFDKVQEMEFGKSNSKAIETQTIDMYPTLSLYVEAIKSKDNLQYELKTKPIINEPIINYGITTSDRDKNKNKVYTDKSDKLLRIGLISTPFFTIPPIGYSGLEQVIWDLACALDELGHDVTIFGPEGSQSTRHGQLVITGPSINTVGVNWYEEERKRYEVYKNIITPEKYDIIHDHSWFAFPYLLKINNPKLNIIKTHHGGFNWDSLPNIKPNLVAISKFMANYTESYFRQKGYNIQCQYVYNGIDLDKYPFQHTKTEHLLFVGRLSTFKQPHIAVEIARKTNHKLDIIGGTFVDNDQYVMQLEKMVENDPNITIFKDASHSLKIEKMKDAKALLFPSRMNEPFGLCALEAMSCGTPVIALNDGAISEVVINQKTGFVCNSVDEMIHDVLEHIPDIKPEDCRARAEQLSRKVMAENYLNLYRKVIRGEEW